jgi:ABC-type transport system substrate-binding protein
VQNPILTVLKIAAFTILAFLVGMDFWQGLKQEDRIEDLARRLGTMEGQQAGSVAATRESAQAQREATAATKALVDALSRIATSGLVRAGPDAGTPQGQGRPSAGPGGSDDAPGSPGGPGPEDVTPALGAAQDEGPPPRVQGRARELWGRYPNYLTPDPKPVRYPPLDAPGADTAARLRIWYGPGPSKINAITASDARLTIRIKTYCLDTIGQSHVEDPYGYAPALAERVEVNPDHTEYVVWLRPDVRWHPPQVDLTRYPHLRGEHFVTAHDFAFTMDRIKDPTVDAASLRSYYTECRGIEVVDDHCFIVHWNKPQWQSIEFTFLFYPVPRFVFAFDETGAEYPENQVGLAFNDHWFYRGNHWIGCGPYYVVEYQPDSHWLLRRFDDYYGDLPPIWELHQEIFPTISLANTKLERGDFDLDTMIPRDYDRALKQGPNAFTDGRIDEMIVGSTQYSFIGWKNTHPIFEDVKVRRAMTHACDRPRILNTLALGKGRVITGPHQWGTPFYPDDIPVIPFDLDAARRLLEEAGWKDADGNGVLEKDLDGVRTDFVFTAMVPDNDQFRPIFEIFREDLLKIGVQMELEFLQWNQFAKRLDERDFACTALLWSGSGWESDLYQIWHSSQIEEIPSSNFIEFKDEEVDRLIVELRTVFDKDERVKMQRRLHERLHELQPYTFLNNMDLHMLWWKDRLENVAEGTRYRLRPQVRFLPMMKRKAE